MKRSKPIESLILTIRGRKVLIDADLADIYGVETRTLNQPVNRHAERFTENVFFRLNTDEKSEVITNNDHLAHMKFAKRKSSGNRSALRFTAWLRVRVSTPNMSAKSASISTLRP